MPGRQAVVAHHGILIQKGNLEELIVIPSEAAHEKRTKTRCA